MPFVERNSARIWYGDAGSGPATLLVHGGLFDPMDGERFWVRPGVAPDLVEAGRRALMPDRRFGGGRTSAPVALHSWEVEAADLLAVLRDAGCGPAHVAAGSNGCSAAIRLALAAPDLVRSLALCWPADPDAAALTGAFERSAALVERAGSDAYLAELRAHGLPRPDEPRAGFLFGAALLSDERAAATFRTLSAHEAATILRDTAAALLAGELLRGVSTDDARTLGALAIPVLIIPAEPETRWHPRATAERLAAHIPGARLARGFPESPLPGFAPLRSAFTNLLRHFASDAEAAL